MANKYIRHGATFNGDGTTSSAAASNGAAGAWNNINILEGTAPTYGSLATGDVVYIRSKDEGGADITRAVSAANVTLGKSGATVSWVLDAGTVWSGINGTLKYNCDSGYGVLLQTNNRFVAKTNDAWWIYCNNAAAGNYYLLQLAAGSYIRGWLIDTSICSTGYGPQTYLSSAVAESCHWKAQNRYTRLMDVANYELATLIDPDIELIGTPTDPVFKADGFHCCIRVFGGQIRGAGAIAGTPVGVGGSYGGQYRLFGLKYPSEMPLLSSAGPNEANIAEYFGNDGVSGSALNFKGATLDSRNDGYYPTLNAALPDSVSTPWSYKLYPANRIMHEMALLYANAAAAKTVTLELQRATSWSGASAPNSANLWIVVCYVDDATGTMKSVASRDMSGSALSSSTASWSATSYGAVGLTKEKIAVTTPTSIKQNTMVYVVLCSECSVSSVNDLIFFCPAPQLT